VTIRPRILFSLIIGLVLTLFALIGFLQNNRTPTENLFATPNLPPRTSPEFPAPPPNNPRRASPITHPSANPIELLLSLLKKSAATETDLDSLQRFLLDSPSTLATTAILEFLESGRDASTGLEFAIRPGGFISSPTLRILLLDTLGRIAKRNGSGPAAQLARATLEKKDSADEWAIALRNLAWQEPQSTVFLAGKIREMLNYPPWRSAPTSGLLEAFDLFVFTKDPTLTADLVALQDDPLPEIRRAADVALDRLAAANPLEIMGYLNAHPSLLADRPLIRADYFAKADLTQAGQKTALEFYLGRPDTTLEEKDKLLKALATPASFVSDNLLTDSPPELDEAQREHAILAALHEWLTNRRFPSLQDQLLALQRRLARE
jgi:hypothetical protein